MGINQPTHNGEDVAQTEAFDDPFAYSLALGSAAGAMQVVWDRWHAAAEECQKHQVGLTYEVGHEHGTLTAIRKMHQMLGDILERADHSDRNEP